jgi:hypothetical protein
MSRRDEASATTTTFSVSFLRGTQILLHILQGVIASITAKRDMKRFFQPLKVLILWPLKTLMW